MSEKFNVFLISSEGKIGMYVMDPLTRKNVPYWYTPKEFKVLMDNNVDIYNAFTAFGNSYEF